MNRNDTTNRRFIRYLGVELYTEPAWGVWLKTGLKFIIRKLNINKPKLNACSAWNALVFSFCTKLGFIKWPN